MRHGAFCSHCGLPGSFRTDGEPDSAHQVGEAWVASQAVERRVDAEELQLDIARGKAILQRRERLLTLAQCGVENRQLARRDVRLARLQSLEDRLRSPALPSVRVSRPQIDLRARQIVA